LNALVWFPGMLIFAGLSVIVILAFIAYTQRRKAYRRGEDI
jgi:hypothetical protein